jgi:rfaE bifunctional protein kinase chain/domain
VKKFDNKKVSVVGDILLDNYVFGRVSRINPERPGYPLLTVEREEYRLGGAGNVAVNLSSLGAQTSLFGVIGADLYGSIIKKLCKKRSVKLFPAISKRTILKQRWVESSHNDYFGRADFGEHNLKPINNEEIESIYKSVIQQEPEIIILSDYNKSVLKGSLGGKINNWARTKGIDVIVAPKPVNINAFKGISLICPNLKESKEIVGPIHSNKNLSEIAKQLKEVTKSKYAIITCGSKGMVSYDGTFKHIPTQAKEIVDVTGAGDTTIAALTLAISSGATLQESAFIANIAAGVVCDKMGTSTITQKRLLNEISKLGDTFK